MPPSARWLVVISCAAAFATFCAVQDWLVRDGAARYVAAQRAALASHRPPIPIDRVMGPAVGRSVRMGFLAGGAVLLVGLGSAAAVVRRR